ncbi:serine-protein kinase ATM-like [Zophobas morio]|uniref:serine-protein kinase ATM-like n=1 Tax=Zophobas morio TaxID=2755281 RepID=UPI0030835E94
MLLCKSQNIKIRKLAAKLLGKVASVNVFSLIGNFTNTTDITHESLLHDLSDFLVHTNFEIVNAARVSIANLLKIGDIKNIVNSSPTLRSFLEPFSTKSIRTVSLLETPDFAQWPRKPHVEAFTVASLFEKKIETEAQLDEWIIIFTCSVIYYFVKNEVLERLRLLSETFSHVFDAQVLSFSVYYQELSKFFLDILTFLRRKDIPLHFLKKNIKSTRKVSHREFGVVWERNFWLDLNLVSVAQAAYRCYSFSHALYLIEVWCEANNLSNATLHQTDCSKELKELQVLLQNIYLAIDEPDSLFSARYSSNVISNLNFFTHEHQHYKVLDTYDLLFRKPALRYSTPLETLRQPDNPESFAAVVSAMQTMGYSHLLRYYLKGISNEKFCWTDQLSECYYEFLWKNSVWDPEDHPKPIENISTSHKNLSTPPFPLLSPSPMVTLNKKLYLCFRALKFNKKNIFKGQSNMLLNELISKMNNVTIEVPLFYYIIVISMIFITSRNRKCFLLCLRTFNFLLNFEKFLYYLKT